MRKRIPAITEREVFMKSRRRCCLCYGLNRDTTVKIGQITHLDRNSGNHYGENLTWMCLQHHNEYDSISSESKNYTKAEVKTYIRELDEYIQEEFLQVRNKEEPGEGIVRNLNHRDIDKQNEDNEQEIGSQSLAMTSNSHSLGHINSQ